jgi:hypothetical protein
MRTVLEETDFSQAYNCDQVGVSGACDSRHHSKKQNTIYWKGGFEGLVQEMATSDTILHGLLLGTFRNTLFSAQDMG